MEFQVISVSLHRIYITIDLFMPWYGISLIISLSFFTFFFVSSLLPSASSSIFVIELFSVHFIHTSPILLYLIFFGNGNQRYWINYHLSLTHAHCTYGIQFIVSPITFHFVFNKTRWSTGTTIQVNTFFFFRYSDTVYSLLFYYLLTIRLWNL